MKSMSYENTVHYRMYTGVILYKMRARLFFEKKKIYSWLKTYTETLKIHRNEDSVGWKI